MTETWNIRLHNSSYVIPLSVTHTTMKPTTTTPAPYAAWQADLVKAIRATIKRARRDGLTGMGIDNLRQGTRIPVGGPTGTNVQYFYAMVWFPAALAALKGADAAFIK